MQRELQERAKFEITGTRVLRQKLKQRLRGAKQVWNRKLIAFLRMERDLA